MAKKDHKEINLEIIPLVSELNDYIEEVEGKINGLMMRVNSAKSNEKVKALKVRIGALKKTQEDVKQRFNDFIRKNCQHDNQERRVEIDKSFEDVKARIEEFKKEEENVEERLNELMTIQFDKSDAGCGEKKCCEFLGAKGFGIQGIKIKEDYFKDEVASSDDHEAWTHIEGLELKMHELVLEGKDLLKKDKNDLKKSLIQWIKASSEEQEALKAVKDQAVELGTDLSFLLVDLVFIMSEKEELLEIFEKFKSLLGTVFIDENFMVMNKIIALLEMTDGEMKELSKMTKESMEGSLKTIADTELDMSELCEGLVEERQIDELLIQILKAVLHLEYILMHPRLPHSKKSKKEDVKAGLKQYEEHLKGVEMRINELKESSSFIFGSEDMQRVEFLNSAVQCMVIEFWNRLGESFEEKEPRRD